MVVQTLTTLKQCLPHLQLQIIQSLGYRMLHQQVHLSRTVLQHGPMLALMQFQVVGLCKKQVHNGCLHHMII